MRDNFMHAAAYKKLIELIGLFPTNAIHISIHTSLNTAKTTVI